LVIQPLGLALLTRLSLTYDVEGILGALPTVSTIGSRMTTFAIAVWAFEATGLATTLTLIGFATSVSNFFASFFSGYIVDRFSRKKIIIISDLVSAFTTLVLFSLLSFDALEIWHLYLVASVNSTFTNLQDLSFSASKSLLVPKKDLSRVANLGLLSYYISSISSPALASSVLALGSINTVLLIDLFTFILGICLLLPFKIPQPEITSPRGISFAEVYSNVLFGFKYILNQRALLLLVITTAVLKFNHDFANVLFIPFVLAKSGESAEVLAIVTAAGGVGGIVSASIFAFWSSKRRLITDYFWGWGGIGLFKLLFSISSYVPVWVGTQLAASVSISPAISSRRTLFMKKIPPAIQGRVFAAWNTIAFMVASISMLLAGPLADFVYEPLILSNAHFYKALRPLVGDEAVGIAFARITASAFILLTVLVASRISTLTSIDQTLKDVH
jgi:DHA3 family macrolide efflux protein-like MFS transporter